MSSQLDGKKIAFLVANEGVEQVELTSPREAVEGAGAATELISIEPGEVQAFNHLDKGDKFPVDRTVDAAASDDYDALVLPGGVANPDLLRINEGAVRFVRSFVDSGKPIGVICHGPWTLVEAGAVKGRTITSWPSLRTDITNAGGEWVDREVVNDHGLVSSRKPDDLPAFNAKIIEEFAEGIHRVAGRTEETQPEEVRAGG
jgi:protease I